MPVLYVIEGDTLDSRWCNRRSSWQPRCSRPSS